MKSEKKLVNFKDVLENIKTFILNEVDDSYLEDYFYSDLDNKKQVNDDIDAILSHVENLLELLKK